MYKVRPVTEADRAQYERFERNARERGDAEEASCYQTVIPEWEAEVGQEREVLACAICGRRLEPTRAGTARRHQRWESDAPSWGRVAQIRKEIATLNEELDRVLLGLESDE
jgi:hypothetical protein